MQVALIGWIYSYLLLRTPYRYSEEGFSNILLPFEAMKKREGAVLGMLAFVPQSTKVPVHSSTRI